MKFDLIGWGALNIDRLCKVNDFALEDGETFIYEEKKTCGGSASNTIIGASKLGLNTGYIGKIGNDSNGIMMKEYLEENAVDTQHLLVDENDETGEVIGFIDSNGNRKLYVTPKVNDKIQNEEIDRSYIKNTNILHLTSFVGLNPDDPSIKTQFELLDEISSDVRVSFDPGMLYVEKGEKLVEQILKYTDILLINETELLMATDEDKFEDAVEKVSKYVDILVVKRSTEGSFIKKDDEEYNIGIFNVDTVDTTGAGDAYNAGFLYGISNDYSLKESGIIASYIAAKSTTQTGATEAIPSIDTINIQEIIKSYESGE